MEKARRNKVIDDLVESRQGTDDRFRQQRRQVLVKPAGYVRRFVVLTSDKNEIEVLRSVCVYARHRSATLSHKKRIRQSRFSGTTMDKLSFSWDVSPMGESRYPASFPV